MPWYDSKLLDPLSLLTGYSIYLYLRIGKTCQAENLALWNVGSFLIVLINFFLFGQLSSFHFMVLIIVGGSSCEKLLSGLERANWH